MTGFWCWLRRKLRENWSIYTLNDRRNLFSADRFHYDVLNHTDLSRESGKSGDIDLATVNWGNYDLVVIDESHNFRNNPPVKGHITRYERLMNDIIRAGVKTRVLMLSATPVNNRMNDIKNQIAFITEGKNDAFSEVGIPSIEHVLRKAQLVFNRWSELPDEERTSDTFVEMMDLSYFKLLDTISEIDLLIATDCISEGQNLQDCDWLINYDIHWNPVRIIQRFGRIDRIGSPNEQIQLVNFWPNMELDEYINLEQRVSGTHGAARHLRHRRGKPDRAAPAT
jgi:SNF2 family DNA or RNA helicase